MGAAHAIVEQLVPDLDMHVDVALSEEIRSRLYQGCRFKGKANLLIMPNLDTANTAFNLLKAAGGDGVTVGRILIGTGKARPQSDPHCHRSASRDDDGPGRGGCSAF